MKTTTLVLACATLLSMSAAAQSLDDAMKARLQTEIELAHALAKEPTIVNAVKAHNSGPSAEAAGMTQDRWKNLSVLDPQVRGFTKNASAELLKARKSARVTEVFLSGANGTKVSFLTKPSGFSHLGKAKHDDPMAGKVWVGDIEVDESTGAQQIQISVPVLDGEKPIGSLVVGLSVTKLKEDKP